MEKSGKKSTQLKNGENVENVKYIDLPDHKIAYREWAVQNPENLLFIAHGLGEHSGRYEELALFFNKHNISVYAIDHYGHGLSGGKRGHIESFENYSNHLKTLISHIKKDFSKQKIHLLGHSLGGVIIHGFMLRYPKEAVSVTISAPGFEKRVPPSAVKAILGKLLANIFPKLSLGNELVVEHICRDKDVVEEYKNDPLVHDRVTAKFFTSFLAEIEFIKKNLNKIECNILYLLPMADKLVNSEKSIEFFEKLSGKNNKLVRFGESYHEVLNESEFKKQAFEEILYWIL